MATESIEKLDVAVKDHFLYVNGEKVEYRPTPNRGGKLNPEGLIFHDTASGLNIEGPASWLCNPAAKASAHLIIDREGRIIQLAPFNVQTWHAGASSYDINGSERTGLNKYTIGVELVNPGRMRSADTYHAQMWNRHRFLIEDYGIKEVATLSHGSGFWMPYTKSQLDLSLIVSSVLAKEYDFKTVAGHYEISPGRKIDPSPLFPLDKIREKLEGRAEGADKSQEEETPEAVRVNLGTPVPLHRWPSSSSTILVTNIRGARVEVLRKGHSAHGPHWWKVATCPARGFPPTVGWMNTEPHTIVTDAL